MKSLIIFMILFPMVVFAQASGQPTSSKNESPSLPAGYATKDCDKKCTKSQQCALKAEDERYYCMNSGPSAKTPKPLEVCVSCRSIGGTLRGQCSSREIVISAISGKNQIPVQEDKPGQCCIAKSRLKVY